MLQDSPHSLSHNSIQWVATAQCCASKQTPWHCWVALSVSDVIRHLNGLESFNINWIDLFCPQKSNLWCLWHFWWLNWQKFPYFVGILDLFCEWFFLIAMHLPLFWWATHTLRIYIPAGYTRKECFRGRTKLSEGQLFTFRNHQQVVCRAQRG